MAYLVGTLVGGLIGVALLAAIIERFAFKTQPPKRRAEYTVGFALILAAIFAGFGAANGGSFVWTAGWTYLPGAAIVFIWYRKRYEQSWSEDPDQVPDAL